MDYWNILYNEALHSTRSMTPTRIKNIRKMFALTQKAFSKLIGVKFDTYRNWEKGYRYPSSPGCAILQIAEASPEEFIKHKEKMLQSVQESQYL